jgi:hypothetical protein
VLDQGVLRRGKYTKSKQTIRGWQDRDMRVLEAICNMPTKKTISLEKLKNYIAFITQRMDVMLEFSQVKSFCRLHLRKSIFMKKKTPSALRETGLGRAARDRWVRGLE